MIWREGFAASSTRDESKTRFALCSAPRLAMNQRRGSRYATVPLLTTFGRTPAANAASPEGGLLRCPGPRLGSLFAAQDQPRHERAPQQPRKRLIAAPRFGGRVVQTRGSDRGRRPRRERVAQPKRSLQIRELERASGRRLAPLSERSERWGAERMRGWTLQNINIRQPNLFFNAPQNTRGTQEVHELHALLGSS